MSTIRVNTLQNTSTTDGGISIDTSGHVTVDGVAMPSSGALSNRNLIINGAMQVAQRGTSSTSTGYLVDRFEIGFGGGAVTTSQESLSSGDPYNEGFRKFLRLTNSTSATASNSYREITQKIEAQNLANSGWNYTSSDSFVTLSFWVRASVAQTYYVKLKTNDGTAQAYGSAFSLSADTWTKVTKTIPGNSNITINNDNGNGFNVAVVPFYGTDFTDNSFVTDAWAAYVDPPQLPDMTNTWAGTTNATFDITGVQLELGEVATPFEHRSYGDELARCQRYYWNMFFGENSANNAIAQGTSYNGSTTFFTVYPPVSMRAEPSLEASNTASYYIGYYNSTNSNVSTLTFDGAAQPNAIEFSASTGASGGQAVILRRQNANAILRFSAEL